MLGAYLTLAETGRVLGVDAERVRDLIVNGPLIGITRERGLMVHEDDLRAFRRPLPISASESESYSALCQLADPVAKGIRRVPVSLHLATVQTREVAPPGLGARRGTMATKGYRALADVAEIQRQGERFMRFVSPEPNTGCHLWTGCFDTRYGYGQFKIWPAKVIAMAHRVAWVLAFGLIPERTDIDHAECNNRWCVNPAHLEAVSHAENIRRRDKQRAARGLPDNCAIARAAVAGRHLHLVQP